MIKLTLTFLLLFSIVPSWSMNVIEADPTKVVIIEDNSGTVTIVLPRALDYEAKRVILKQNQKGVSLKDKIFGKKCGR